MIEPCDFVSVPAGGQLTFARQLMESFGNRLALVGFTTDEETPVGRWTKRVIDGTAFDYFAFCRFSPSPRRPLIPARLKVAYHLRKYRGEILARADAAFVQSHEVLLTVANWKLKNLCYYFPGVENPLRLSRYDWAKPFARLFDFVFLRAVGKADVVLAAADQEAIRDLARRSGRRLQESQIASFPTRVNSSVFCAGSKRDARRQLSLPTEAVIWVTTGRIHWAKGWQLLLESFQRFAGRRPDARLIFVGDGPDRPRLEEALASAGLQDSVRITGFVRPPEIARYLQASDVYVLGSEAEGWSTALVEALSCGCRIVSTNVSSASTLVSEGTNGRIVPVRSPEVFAQTVEAVLRIPEDTVLRHSEVAAAPYSSRTLLADLRAVWPVFPTNPLQP